MAYLFSGWDATIGKPGLDGHIWDLEAVGSGSPLGAGLYACGEFTTAGGITVNKVAKWDGSNWSALGGGLGGGDCTTLELGPDNGLHVGGTFTSAGGVAAHHMASWERKLRQPRLTRLVDLASRDDTTSVQALGAEPDSAFFRGLRGRVVGRLRHGAPSVGSAGAFQKKPRDMRSARKASSAAQSSSNTRTSPPVGVKSPLGSAAGSFMTGSQHADLPASSAPLVAWSLHAHGAARASRIQALTRNKSVADTAVVSDEAVLARFPEVCASRFLASSESPVAYRPSISG